MSLSRDSFEFVRQLVLRDSGHCLEDDKSYLVETRLAALARHHGFATVEEFVRQLRDKKLSWLLGEVVQAMTINETFFFRDGLPFDALRDVIIPELLLRRQKERRLNIWSAACSSGQEPYSLALLLHRHFPALRSWNSSILASDLSLAMLERARRGVYTDMEMARGLDDDCRREYFQAVQGGWQLCGDIRNMVEFRMINLNGVWPAMPRLDLVLLRNVFIYFARSTRQQILDKVANLLHPDGYLLLGGAESTLNVDSRYHPVTIAQTTFFRTTLPV